MGNDHSSDNRGNIFVRTEKPFYFAGEQVFGTVYLNIWNQGYPGVQINLKIKGREECHWTETRTVQQSDGHGGTRTVHHTDHYDGKNQFYSHKFILYTFTGQSLPPGQYAFPFQFVLFPHLPGSFFEQGHDYKAMIKYKVKCEVESFDKHVKNIKHSQDLIVREPMKSNIQALAGEMKAHPKTWCCIAQGESYMKCVFDKNNYLPGEHAFLWVDIDNSECKLDITEIKAELKQILTLRSQSGRQKYITIQLSTETIPGISAGSHAKDDNRKTMKLHLVNKRNQNDQNLKPSTNGSIVKSVYDLTATANLKGCTCCSQNPHVTVPIVIVSPVPISYEQVQQPENWNPQTFEPKLFQFSDNDLYAKPQGDQKGFDYPSQNQNISQMNSNM